MREVDKMTLEDIVYRLLHHRSFREKFLAGQYAEIGVTPAQYQDLQTIEIGELLKSSSKIVRDLLGGVVPGGISMADSYPNTMKILKECGVDTVRLMEDFLESTPYQETNFLPAGEPGLSIEEAFYLFLVDREDVRLAPKCRDWLVHEFLMNIISLLLINHNPNFIYRSDLIKFNGVGHFAIMDVPDFIAEASGKKPQPGRSFLYAAARNLVFGFLDPQSEMILKDSLRQPLTLAVDDAHNRSLALLTKLGLINERAAA